MKGCGTLVVLGIIAIVLLLVAAADPEPLKPSWNDIPQGVELRMEVNEKLVGSYSIVRTGMYFSTWDETGDWTPLEYIATMGGPVVCFDMYESKDSALFWADQNHHWVPFFQNGETCLRLEKIR